MKLFNKYRPDKIITSAASASPDNKAMSMLFDNLNLDLQGNRPDLSDSTTFTFHIETEVDDARPDILVDIRYFISKSPNTVAKLVFMGAESLRSEDFLFGAACDDSGLITVSCPGRKEAVGVPFTFTIGLFAHRVNGDESVLMQVNSVDIRSA